jgi:NDP-sugar pyrophosphorylase family protein
VSGLLPVCLLAGGRGSRLGGLVAETPKPLLEVAGEPFLRHPLRALAEAGGQRVVLCVGYLADQFEEVLGDGADLGLELCYVHDGPTARGTAGAVVGALPLLGEEFFVLYGDTYLRLDYGAVQAAYRASGRRGLMTVLRNEGRWDTSNAVLDGDRVALYDKGRPIPAMQWIDYGLGVLRRDVFNNHPDEGDLAAVYRDLSRDGQLAAYEATERFYEIGTPEALAEAERFLAR